MPSAGTQCFRCQNILEQDADFVFGFEVNLLSKIPVRRFLQNMDRFVYRF
jgi:hypothetical protein